MCTELGYGGFVCGRRDERDVRAVARRDAGNVCARSFTVFAECGDAYEAGVDDVAFQDGVVAVAECVE